MQVKCPRCGTESVWENNPHRPFCSAHCRIIDLGHWVTESYRIPVKDQDQDEDGSSHPPVREQVE